MPTNISLVVACAAHSLSCWNMAGKARTANYGLQGNFEREFWTNTPGAMALVWDFEGQKKAAALKKEAAEKRKAELAASCCTAALP